MNLPLLTKRQIFDTSMYQVKKSIKTICSSPDYKIIYSDNAFEFFHIEMHSNNQSCLIYCSFLSITKVKIRGVFEGYNIKDGTLTVLQVTQLLNMFVNQFNDSVQKHTQISREKYRKQQLEKILEAKSPTTIKPKKENFPTRLLTSKNYKKQTLSNSTKGWWILIWIIIIIVAFAISKNDKIEHVNGYDRKNGVHVNSYYRKPK